MMLVERAGQRIPCVMALLPAGEASGDTWLDKVAGFLDKPFDGVFNEKSELWLMCEGKAAGLSKGACSTREPIKVTLPREWFVKAAPFLQIAAKVIAIATKVGAGVALCGGDVADSVLGPVGAALDKIRQVKDQLTVKELEGAAPELPSDDSVEAAQTLLQGSPPGGGKSESVVQGGVEFSQKEGELYRSFVEMLQNANICTPTWDPNSGSCQGLTRVYSKRSVYWLCDSCRGVNPGLSPEGPNSSTPEEAPGPSTPEDQKEPPSGEKDNKKEGGCCDHCAVM
eukprot:TRINITY_DN27611_c0_g1_i1.p2 TRINITY_DN27611_c0_g1~~TRINITY_DN27611_c0_g1_i1.p2  ORF type:complete len:283 (+),score=61.98 TRINITY_DN27611_c0_g1_i1:61-909(+)